MTSRVLVGDCVALMRALAAESVDAVVCDPPYELNFMGRAWDRSGVTFQRETWAEALRVLKPGGHLLAFGGTRTVHRMAVAIEDAGFEIRDQVAYMYGSGFPKSLDVSKAIDNAAGAEREVIAERAPHTASAAWREREGRADRLAPPPVTAPATEDARRWNGWGTALKPAWESVIVAVKPEDGGTVYANLCQLSNRLLTLLSAKDAAANFECPSTAYDEAFASARWDADELCSTRDALSAATATSQFGSVIASSLNIVSSWLDILADLLSDPSTSITSTGSSTTTVLRILNSCLSELTPLSIIQAVTNPPGSTSVVARADEAFAAAALSTQGTRALSALARATGQAPISRLGEDAPACSPVVVARKPLSGTVADTVLAHGTGAMNIDGCRIAMSIDDADAINAKHAGMDPATYERAPGTSLRLSADPIGLKPAEAHARGRWPANVALEHTDGCARVGERTVAADGHWPGARPAGSDLAGAEGHSGQEGLDERHAAGERVTVWDCTSDCPVRVLNEQSGELPGRFATHGEAQEHHVFAGGWADRADEPRGYGDNGGASRFFYTTKASRAEREAGLDHLPSQRFAQSGGGQTDAATGEERYEDSTIGLNIVKDVRNVHPTVKPVSVMRWLVRLVTPPGGLVLDPFVGSGTTGIACALEGFSFLGIEQSEDYAAIAEARIAYWAEHGEQALRVADAAQTSERTRREREDAGQLDLFAPGV